ncbi:helix-turn-helix domain-containing protein [Kiloniella majae]|uniref:helix-turn-helix domain-containing protein n=1 Tax=Kiloniella majae TaxID=1938558 RepID=UPI000A277FFB|nr:helix-turn-helix domain-containing protein [Kiloniella majae]
MTQKNMSQQSGECQAPKRGMAPTYRIPEIVRTSKADQTAEPCPLKVFIEQKAPQEQKEGAKNHPKDHALNGQKGVHREIIKAEIRKKGISLSALSQSWGYSRNAVSVALQRPWPAIEMNVSQFLGIPLLKLWPERYYQDGTSRFRACRKNNIPKNWSNVQFTKVK